MTNILIADDDEIIRSTIEALLEQYQIENNFPLTLLQAEDGSQACAVCQEKEIDILFLDVMMPVMDGIEAAKKIKKISPKTMIIAISSLSDESKQNQMLKSGAEDYITKPIVATLFTNRLTNYLRIIQNRDSIGFKYNAVNAFTSTIYNYKIEFTVATDDDLTQFWEAVLIRFELQRLAPNANDTIRFLYRLGSLYLDKKYSFKIYIEEDKEFFYISMNNIKLFPKSEIEALISNHYIQALYTIKDNIITFLLNKALDEDIDHIHDDKTPKKTETEKIAQPSQEQPSQTPQPTTPVVDIPKTVQNLQVFHFLDPDELDDLDNFLDKLHHIILRMNSQDLTIDDCQNIAQFFQLIAQTISLSSETYSLSSSLQQLASILTSHQELFIQQSKNLSEFVLAFVNDLIQWKNMVFYSGAPSINFMDASILANIEMITVLLVPQNENESNSVDDIFDF